MANKMLIDATHPEETRVVVLRGNRVEEFDFESAARRQLRGNIYLAKVTRVEPSLQAAFVDYGGNRHGFLAFSEIHPDYYQIPVADRQALIAEEERAHRDAEDEVERRSRSRHRRRHRTAGSARTSEAVRSEPVAVAGEHAESGEEAPEREAAARTAFETPSSSGREAEPESALEAHEGTHAAAATPDENGYEGPAPAAESAEDAGADAHEAADAEEPSSGQASPAGEEPGPEDGEDAEHGNGADGEEEEVVESVGGADAMEEVPDRAPRFRRQYKIQEVIKRRQIMLVQVVKEERGTKGAALTTYLSLAGRYSVLMPNTARGGGISRKITDVQDRKRLKEVAQELEVPEGMGVILRTAGASRTKTEIKRDFEYLLRMWETVRDLTLKSTAPTLVYEEGSLVKRSIRDLYNKDIDEVIVAGDDAYREAKDFMRMLMPSHAKNVKPYKDTQPLFTRYGIESQLDAMFSPVVQLRSGGYIVLNQAEALVAIDVNSGRATREHHIEDTALKTNLEAAEEIARQLRLRDLAGLVVIDFIDMDEKRNNRAVERRLKECLKNDRARIQVGRISHFGLLEMSRQRIRSSVLESSTEKCPHCGGSGHVRSVSSVALQLLRMLEETLLRGATHNLIVRTRADIALYVLNHKRAHLRELEERFQITIAVNADPTMGGQPPFVIDRGEQVHSVEAARALAAAQPITVTPFEVEEPLEEEAQQAGEETAEEAGAEEERAEAGEGGRRRRRRRRRGRRGEGREPAGFTHETVAEHGVAHAEDFEEDEFDGAESGEFAGGPRPAREGGREGGEQRRRRRRGRRGGRRNRHREGEAQAMNEHEAPQFEPELTHAVADFGGPPVPESQRESPTAEFAERESAPPVPESGNEPEPPEPPRRRSTVREPAPVFGPSSAPPSAPPAAPEEPLQSTSAAAQRREEQTATEEEDAGQPRRSGWWSRRIAGEKS
jgi:ribonuclease E